ncbi:hypothetical protein A3C59_03915, partial [Candidatus Daviesbacteria bacterium RIFCSPHIGHO2_02_FULL_36_13]
AARTVEDTYSEVPEKFRDNIILVDDHSKDNTVEVARRLNIKVITHEKNLGYGGNQKTCYTQALKIDADIIIMLHPDYQYDASLIGELIEPIIKNRYDFMFGSRIQNRTGALLGGMPWYKYYLNRIFCLIENILLGVNFTEHFSGFRAYSADLLRKIPFKDFSNDFVFDQQMTISALKYNFRIGEIPIPTRYHLKASSIGWLRGGKFLLQSLYSIFIFYYLDKLKLSKTSIL